MKLYQYKPKNTWEKMKFTQDDKIELQRQKKRNCFGEFDRFKIEKKVWRSRKKVFIIFNEVNTTVYHTRLLKVISLTLKL